ncbi:MAG TPA: hypothetical protein VHD87_14825 [Acidimicrobiales bacterium]|nr:hypothetical protein [Acidimicrobiales bacterium]
MIVVDEAVRLLVDALRVNLEACGEPVEVRAGVFAGDNLAERLRSALEALAVERGGVEALVAHRPGCWEADHVRQLAAMVDW